MAFSKNRLRVAGIIPARYASTRFPGKPLAMINGKSMIERVYSQASKCSLLSTVVVATDDERIASHVQAFGGKAVMTAAHHPSGTDRIAETIALLEKENEFYDIIVNIQGDEPYIHPQQIEKLIRLFAQERVEIATLIKSITQQDELFNPNVVKVMTDLNGRALLFSRSPIPHIRGKAEANWLENFTFFKHIGLYAYRTKTLKIIASLPPALPEIAESLEQLRWLWNGHQIYTDSTEFETFGIDTPEDLSKLINNP